MDNLLTQMEDLITKMDATLDQTRESPAHNETSCTVGKVTFSAKSLSSIVKEKGKGNGKSRAIRVAVRAAFSEEELATRTPAGGGGKPPLSPGKLESVRSE